MDDNVIGEPDGKTEGDDGVGCMGQVICIYPYVPQSFTYTDIIEALGHKAKEKNEEFQVEYAKVINKFNLEFSKEYCAPDGSILWNKLVQFNSGKTLR